MLIPWRPTSPWEEFLEVSGPQGFEGRDEWLSKTNGHSRTSEEGKNSST